MRLSPLILLLASACDAPPATAPAATDASVGPTADVTAPGPDRDLTADVQTDQAYGTPAQCYARTQAGDGTARNPCYTCHVASQEPNFIGSPELQLSYAFPTPALENRWSNLFVDRSAAASALDDETILAWARTDNYHAPDGTPALAARIADVPPGWDFDKDGAWSGFVPDATLRFDPRGFDVRADGTPTGWRTYAYHPRPGVFLPANGGPADALIRLPDVFRQTKDGTVDLDVYALNLAILEAAILRRHVPIAPADEARHGVDLDRDGQIGTAGRITWDWAPKQDRHMQWVGAAGVQEGLQPPTAGLFPVGTEFLHTLRYFDLVDGRPVLGARMKEVRYLRKRTWKTYGQLQDAALIEAKEDYAYPDRVPPIVGDVESGVRLSNGWMLAGFIEDAHGELRPQTRPELATCTGCHTGASSTDDAIFSFGRKLPAGSALADGWYHWSQHPMAMGDWTRADGQGDYATYLRTARAGDPFGANDEILAAFFASDGAPDEAKLAALATDATPLLLPSPERALALNKVYRVLVSEQTFEQGRLPLPALGDAQVWRKVDEDQPTGIRTVVRGHWETTR